ncbi:MAG: hypothetical protein HYX68_07495 [Planctomycetes bacterium]|nr:hypothetical protein [Planctomycetota bacterium]
MSNLITRARAIYNLNNRATTSDEDTTLDALIAAVSAAIENYCWRTFAVTSYDELYPGQNQHELILRHYPITSVERVAHDPAPVLRVTNASATNQRATVKVTATGLVLIRVASGVSSTSTILFADQVTLTALATAITALGNGWSASVADAAFNLRASADLRSLQGALDAKDVEAELKMHTRELSSFQVDAETGCLTRGTGAPWHGGLHHWRVVYQAGYTAAPEDVQEACAQWVAQLFWLTKRDPGLASESIPATVSRGILREMPISVRILLGPYRTWRV